MDTVHDTERRATYVAWLERYRQAWVDRNPDAAVPLFTENALYREQAFQEPFVGRDAIRAYWARVTASQRDVELFYGEPVVTGNRLAVEWWVHLRHEGNPVTLAGEFMLTFAENGECRELREYWALTEGRHERPAGWGR